MGKPQVSHATPESNRGPSSRSFDECIDLGRSSQRAERCDGGLATQSVLISETFTSRQGEGKLTGTDSFFIRTSGCNLRCWFCDTPYASWSPTGESRSIDTLLREANESNARHVVLTGGEPLVAARIESLCEVLIDAGFHLTIETAGTVAKPIACDLLSLSPKLSDSAPDRERNPRWHQLHEQRRMPVSTMRKLIDAAKDFQLKFVVGKETQFEELREVTRSLAVENRNVFVMPQGVSVAEMDDAQQWLLPRCRDAGYQYCDRMQIRWFGNRRGT